MGLYRLYQLLRDNALDVTDIIKANHYFLLENLIYAPLRNYEQFWVLQKTVIIPVILFGFRGSKQSWDLLLNLNICLKKFFDLFFFYQNSACLKILKPCDFESVWWILKNESDFEPTF